jgi:hypothetical protein
MPSADSLFSERIPSLKAVTRGLLGIAVLIAVWLAVDLPTGGDHIEGKVISSYATLSRYGYADIKTTVRFPDGTMHSYSSLRLLETGASVSCIHRRRLVSNWVSYQC